MRLSNSIALIYHAQYPIIDDQPPFPFLDLPPELRNRIYTHFFTSLDFPDDLGVWQIEVRSAHDMEHNTYNFIDTQNKSMSALLQTCRQVYHEARLIPFHGNTIYFDKPRDMVEFTCQLDPEQLTAVRSIEVPLDEFDGDVWSWGVVKFFPGLRVLRLDVGMSEMWKYLSGIEDGCSRRIKMIRRLVDLEIRLHRDDDAATEEEKADLKRLEEMWKPIVTQAWSAM